MDGYSRLHKIRGMDFIFFIITHDKTKNKKMKNKNVKIIFYKKNIAYL